MKLALVFLLVTVSHCGASVALRCDREEWSLDKANANNYGRQMWTILNIYNKATTSPSENQVLQLKDVLTRLSDILKMIAKEVVCASDDVLQQIGVTGITMQDMDLIAQSEIADVSALDRTIGSLLKTVIKLLDDLLQKEGLTLRRVITSVSEQAGGIQRDTESSDGLLSENLGINGLLSILLGPDGLVGNLLGDNGLLGSLLGKSGAVGNLLREDGLVGEILGNNGLVGGLLGGDNGGGLPGKRLGGGNNGGGLVGDLLGGGGGILGG